MELNNVGLAIWSRPIPIGHGTAGIKNRLEPYLGEHASYQNLMGKIHLRMITVKELFPELVVAHLLSMIVVLM